VRILDRYLLGALLGAVLMVALVFLVLGALFVFIGQQDDIGVGTYSWRDALLFVLLNLPAQAWQLLPITTMIGSLVGLGALARGSELTIVRAAGYSVWRVAAVAAVAGLLLAGVGALLGEVLSPPLLQLAKERKVFAKFADNQLGGAAGIWVRDGNRLVNLERQSVGGRFGGFMVVELSDDYRLVSVGRAVAATASADGTWQLSQYVESRFAADGVSAGREARRTLKTSLSPEFLGSTALSPSQMPVRALWSMNRYLASNGIENRPFVFAFWSRVARLAAIVFAAMLAVPFVFGSLRSAGGGARAVLGVGVGLGFFLLQNLLENGAIAFDANPVALAWIPTGLLALAVLGLTSRTR
jgi:lipopolysaccharide export system permease protein